MNENRIDIMLKAQIKYTEKLWREKEELQQKIDKAIEYIKRDEFVDYIPNSKSYLRLMKIRCDLLEILGDKENE